MNSIEKAKKESKQLINQAYQVEEIFRKLKSFYGDKFNILIHKQTIMMYPVCKKENFTKFRNLFVEEFEDEFKLKYVREDFNEYGGFYVYQFKYLDVAVGLYFYPNETCELIEESVTEKRFRMKC